MGAFLVPLLVFGIPKKFPFSRHCEATAEAINRVGYLALLIATLIAFARNDKMGLLATRRKPHGMILCHC